MTVVSFPGHYGLRTPELALKTRHVTLKSILFRTGSQCNCCNTGVMWSRRRVPVISRAAAFGIDWSNIQPFRWPKFLRFWSTFVEHTTQRPPTSWHKLRTFQTAAENFSIQRSRRIVTFWYLRLVNTFTYLLTYLLQIDRRLFVQLRSIPVKS